jgi:hypothetical protein
MDAGKTDRTAIAGLLGAFFPAMADATSDQWHDFLNAETGLEVPFDEPNASAFDKWRMALADKGLPVWGVSKARQDAINERAAILKRAEDDREAKANDSLAALKVEAPDVKARDMLKGGKK